MSPIAVAAARHWPIAHGCVVAARFKDTRGCTLIAPAHRRARNQQARACSKGEGEMAPPLRRNLFSWPLFCWECSTTRMKGARMWAATVDGSEAMLPELPA